MSWERQTFPRLDGVGDCIHPQAFFSRISQVAQVFPPQLQMHRRTLLRQLGASGLWVVCRPLAVWATPAAVQQAIRRLIGARQPQDGGMTITLPKIAESGNSVSLVVAVDSPMTADHYVRRIHVLVEGNPEPVAATYHLGVRAGKAQMSTRLRLARSQTVVALADMHDDTVRSAAASIVVTLGACVEEIWQN